MADIDITSAQHVAAVIRGDGGKATAIMCDIGIDESVRVMVAEAVTIYGGLDLIHVNAADLSIIGRDLD